MNITPSKRQQAEDWATETQLRLYADPESGEKLWTIATNFGLTERTDYYNFTQLVGDIILGFYKTSDTLPLIQQNLPNVQPVKQLELEMEIKKFLLPLSTTTPSLQTEIAEIETATKSLEAVHTMQNDVARVQQETPTYQSSQDALLQKSDAPLQTNPTTPRWDTQ